MTKEGAEDGKETAVLPRVAEEIVFCDVSTGARNDLQRATDMARHMITQYGMSESLWLATLRIAEEGFS